MQGKLPPVGSAKPACMQEHCEGKDPAGPAQQGVTDNAQILPCTDGRVKVSWKENILAARPSHLRGVSVLHDRGQNRKYLTLRTGLERLRDGGLFPRRWDDITDSQPKALTANLPRPRHPGKHSPLVLH